jgi:hypothetical protein
MDVCLAVASVGEHQRRLADYPEACGPQPHWMDWNDRASYAQGELRKSRGRHRCAAEEWDGNALVELLIDEHPQQTPASQMP